MALEAKYGDLHSLRIDRSQKEPENPKWSKRFIIGGIAAIVLLGVIVLAVRLFSASIPEVQTVRAATISSASSGETVLQAAGYIVAHYQCEFESHRTHCLDRRRKRRQSQSWTGSRQTRRSGIPCTS